MKPLIGLLLLGGAAAIIAICGSTRDSETASPPASEIAYQPRQGIETSGFIAVFMNITPWSAHATFEEYAEAYDQAIPKGLAPLDRYLDTGQFPVPMVLMTRANLFNAQGKPELAYKALEDLESRIRGTALEAELLYTAIFYKGVSALRMGENDNCVMCRGESSCIFPIAPAAVHTNPAGSRLAIRHFTEYLQRFPDDLEVKWLLHVANMTLGESPDRIDPRHRISLEAFNKSDHSIGPLRDISHRVGLTRMNQSGGAILDDFDNDGLFDLVVTSWAPSEPMAFFRNKGDGTFEEKTAEAGLARQRGGLYCVQTDFNNDGHLDIFIPRGSWLPKDLAQRPSLLRNNGDGTFTDVSREANITTPTNSTSSSWADFDNDGFLDLFVCCQKQPCLVYRNKGDGTFEEVSGRAGLANLPGCLGSAWIDYDNDDYPDLFLNFDNAPSRLFHNNRNGTFTDATKEMGIDGPFKGFSCWAFDYDNDGWLDIFAATFDHTLEGVVQGLMDQPHKLSTARLYRNLGGKRFQNVTREMGLDKVYSPMGSNFGDLDGDGYLDFYLGTGDPELSTLVPNRLFRNVGGRKFAEITASSRTGHLQKGHGVAFGDWDRNGTTDLFVELGGAIKGDSYHNVLFQNPGQGNNWLSVKLIGEKSNRAAIGARIKVVTAGENPLTVHRHVTSGSSFGANPLEQHIGLGPANRVALLEIHWPRSGTTQVFRDIDINQGLVIQEFGKSYQRRNWKPIAVPE